MRPGGVLLLTDSLDVGGGEQHVVDAAIALHRRGHSVMVACSAGGALSASLRNEGVEIRELGRRPVKRRVSLLLAWRLRRLIREQRPKAVHSHMYASTAAGVLATMGTSVPLVLTEHSEARWRGAGARWISRRLYRRASRIIAVSIPIQRRLVAQDRAPAERISVIPCCVMPASERNGERPPVVPQSPVVGVVARLQAEKGVGDFLAAAARVAGERPACSFMVVGDGPLRARLTSKAQRLGLGSSVHFLGFRLDARALIAAMDVLVVPSRSEGAPLVILEAMSAGVPVIATEVGGIPHQVGHGVEGLLVPPADPVSLSEAILTILANPVTARQYGEAGRLRVATRFNFESMIEEIEQTYRTAGSGSVQMQPVAVKSGERS